MNPPSLFCLNLVCASRGLSNEGNSVLHDSLQDRFHCKTCGKTFASSKSTLFLAIRKGQ